MEELRPGFDKNDAALGGRRVPCGIYRRMSDRRKLELVFDTYRTGRLLALAGIRMRHPDASEEELQRLWAREHLGAELFESVYGGTDGE